MIMKQKKERSSQEGDKDHNKEILWSTCKNDWVLDELDNWEICELKFELMRLSSKQNNIRNWISF